MASTSSFNLIRIPSTVTIVCVEGKLIIEPKDYAILSELNFTSPFSDSYHFSLINLEIQVMSMITDYCRHHDGKFIKLADPLTLFKIYEAAYKFGHKNLIDLTYQTLVSMVKGKSVEEIRTNFIINQQYDWNSTRKPRARETLRRKEAFIMPSDFDFVQRSHRETKALRHVYMGRWKSIFEDCVGMFLECKSLGATRALSSMVEDQIFARRLEHDHVVLLFHMLGQRTPKRDIEKEVLRILSRVNFTAHKKAMGTDEFELLVKVIDYKVFGIYSSEMAPLAMLTLTNIVKALPEFVVDILETDVLECVKRILLAPRTVEIVNRIAMFLVAVCRTNNLSRIFKVDLALATLQVLELNVSLKHDIEQACNAFQYLTYGMELQIEELPFKKLIEKLIAIIEKPPPGNCQFPGYALGVLGNISIWGSSDQIKILASNSMLLESLVKAMIDGSNKIQKEACVIISQVAVQMEGLLEEMHFARLIEVLCGLLEKDEYDLKRDASLAIYSGIYGSFFSRVFVEEE